jgi:tetratricopeptide (TPR) repeat protein
VNFREPRRAAAAIDDILRLGVRALEEHRAPDAERLARDALARDSRHPDALHLLGVALLAQKRAREAVAPLEQAAGERSSSRIETHLAKALLESGRDSEALMRLQRAIETPAAFRGRVSAARDLACSMRRFDEAARPKRGLEAEPTSVDLSSIWAGSISSAPMREMPRSPLRGPGQLPGNHAPRMASGSPFI